MKSEKQGKQGCGKITYVIGTNGGRMPCGANLLDGSGKGKPHYCDDCRRAHMSTDAAPFPADAKEMWIQVFCQEGHPPFVCGAHGWIAVWAIAELERDTLADECDRGDGDYLFKANHRDAEYAPDGCVMNRAHWELELFRFRPTGSTP